MIANLKRHYLCLVSSIFIGIKMMSKVSFKVGVFRFEDELENVTILEAWDIETQIRIILAKLYPCDATRTLAVKFLNESGLRSSKTSSFLSIDINPSTMHSFQRPNTLMQ